MKKPFLKALKSRSGVAIFLLVFCSEENALAQVSEGVVNMEGAIYATACTIDTQSLYQTIEMPIMSVGQMARDGIGAEKSFSIRLVSCSASDFSHGQRFTVTFDGESDADGELFGVEGDAEGVALQLKNRAGVIAHPGVPAPEETVTADTMKLDYALQLAGNQQNLRAGDYYTSIRFRVEYY